MGMSDHRAPTPPLDLAVLPAATRAAFRPNAVSARWAAVQQHLHPWLAALATRLDQQASRDLPRTWLLYETSYKTQRYINRGNSRAPIDEYHMAIDRPPRGSGIMVSISGAEQAVLVGIQLRSARKPALRELWHSSRSLWQPVVAQIGERGQVRYTGAPAAPAGDAWLDHYLANRGAGYLWAGFVYPWAQPPADLGAQIIADVLLLLPLNESLMELVEEHTTHPAAAMLREQRIAYATTADTPPIETLVARVQAAGYTYPDTLIKAYHIALHTRPLVILSGVSGMGKTRLTRLYADAMYGISDHSTANPHYLLVAVQPDWHSARDLLGYFNAITGVYHATPLLRLLLRAQADPLRPYFVCLDEMNLARPEYYLAPILAAMETTDQLLDLGLPADSLPMLSGETLHTPLRLPPNLLFTGTINHDDSAHPLTDRLLDRANLIELAGLDLATFCARYPTPIEPLIWAVLRRLVQLTEQAGSALGYRTLVDVLRYVRQSEGILPPLEALDQQVLQKLLPRIRGAAIPRLQAALAAMLAVCAGQEPPDAATPAVHLPQSTARLRLMLERLERDGFTDFSTS